MPRDGASDFARRCFAWCRVDDTSVRRRPKWQAHGHAWRHEFCQHPPRRAPQEFLHSPPEVSNDVRRSVARSSAPHASFACSNSVRIAGRLFAEIMYQWHRWRMRRRYAKAELMTRCNVSLGMGGLWDASKTCRMGQSGGQDPTYSRIQNTDRPS